MPLLNHKIDVNVIFYLGGTSNQSPNMVVAKFQGFFPKKGQLQIEIFNVERFRQTQ